MERFKKPVFLTTGMEQYKNLIKGAFSSAEIPENTRNTPVQEIPNQMGTERVNSLKASVKEIQFLIKERVALSEIMSREVEKIKTNIENFLLANTSVDSDSFKERNGLRQKQVEVTELQLNEKVNCWRDVALLKKELRERQKELSEREERMAILGDMLE
jgi:hypothetical protein